MTAIMSRTIRHWTPRYIVNRMMWALQERMHPREPWLTREACNYIADWLQPHHRGIEWGSGRSTLWLANRMSHLISIEHDPTWYRHIRQQLTKSGLMNVDYRFAVVDSPASTRAARYEDVTMELPNSSLDFALIDGKLRDRCIENVIDKLKTGGLLVLDNAEIFLSHPSHSPSSLALKGIQMEPCWKAIAAKLSSWHCTWTSNGVFDTALFIKPRYE